MTTKEWAVLNDIDVVASNQESALDVLSFILDGMDRAAPEASAGNQDAALWFTSQYENYSKMLFLVLGVIQGQNKETRALLEKAMKGARA